jgi:hypothetical protein
MSDQGTTRREGITKAGYVTPLLIPLKANRAFAATGSGLAAPTDDVFTGGSGPPASGMAPPNRAAPGGSPPPPRHSPPPVGSDSAPSDDPAPVSSEPPPCPLSGCVKAATRAERPPAVGRAPPNTAGDGQRPAVVPPRLRGAPMREHTHSCELCGKERRCSCEDGEDFQYVPCDPCLDDPVSPRGSGTLSAMEQRITKETPPDQSRAPSVTAEPRGPKTWCRGLTHRNPVRIAFVTNSVKVNVWRMKSKQLKI